MRVFHAIQYNVQATAFRGFFESGALFHRTEPNHALVPRAVGRPVKLFFRIKADRYVTLPAQRNQLLQARASGSFGDQHAVEGTSGTQRLPDGMDSYKQGHYDKGTS